jgi:hypothetical protein
MSNMKNVGNKLKLVTAVVLALSLSACGSGSGGKNISIAGVTGPTVAYVNGTFTMSLVIQNATVQGGVRLPIPHMPNSYLEVGPDLQSNGLLISTGLAAADIAAISNGSIVLLDPQSLPGGRPLPGVSAGTLPAIAVEVPSWDHMVFYVGPSVFGLYVPVNLGLPGYMATFRFYDNSGNDIGNISVVGQDTDKKNSGVLLLIPLKGAVGNIVSDAAQN